MANSGEQNFENLRNKCIKDGVLYRDPDFPPEAKSIYTSKPVSKNISWKRPPEINQKSRFIVDGLTRFDLDQGALGNCWFVAAAATLATKPNLLHNVVPSNQSFTDQYAGIFHFYFWRFGEWKEVIIDDYLPVKYGKQLEFCQNKEQPDEFWSALLEKAYAKLNGSYEALMDGKIQDALVDFTGGVSEVIDVTDKKKTTMELFDELKSYEEMNSLMGCSISMLGVSGSQPYGQGLYTSHAYSVTGLTKISVDKQDVSLIRILNPWGKVEWTGNWSDGSPQWDKVSDKVKSELNFKKLEDGEFWMSFDEWRDTFTQLQLCHLTSSSVNHKAWAEEKFHGSWIKGVNAGGSGTTPNEGYYWSNPQYGVILKPDYGSSNGTLVVSLMQKNRRERAASGNKIIGYRLFKIKRNDLIHLDLSVYPKQTVMKDDGNSRYGLVRETAKHYYNLEPGCYCIIPTTYMPNEEAEFLLRVLTKQQIDVSLLEEGPEVGSSSLKMSSKSSYGREIELPFEDPVEIPKSIDDAPKKEKKKGSANTDPMDIQSQIEAEIAKNEISSDKKKKPSAQPSASEKELQKIYDTVSGQAVDSIDACDLQQMLTSVGQAGQLGNHGLRFTIPDCRLLLNLIDNSPFRRLSFIQFQELVNMIKLWLKEFNAHDPDEEEYLEFDTIWKICSSLGFDLDNKVKGIIVLSYGSRKYGVLLSDFISLVAKLTAVRKFKKTDASAKVVLDETLKFVLLT